jgi:4-aminobutyrate---pyruvate transaminase
VRDKERKVPFDPAANIGLFAERACESRGVILRALGDTLAIAPPLVASAPDLEAILETLALALDDTLSYAKNGGLF